MARSNGSFNVNILSETGTIFSGECDALFVPAEKDIVVVLAYHTPMIMKLGKGKIAIKTKHDKQQLADINGGLIYVGDNEVTVLINL